MLPPSLHFEEPNPQIDFAGGPFYVNSALADWVSPGSPRRAGVSSFGIGGTNAHVVLEEAPEWCRRGHRTAGPIARCCRHAPRRRWSAPRRTRPSDLGQSEAPGLADRLTRCKSGGGGSRTGARSWRATSGSAAAALASADRRTRTPRYITRVGRYVEEGRGRSSSCFPAGRAVRRHGGELYECEPVFREESRRIAPNCCGRNSGATCGK